MSVEGLPAFAAIKDLISGTITDEFKLFIEAHSLVSSSIFIILNIFLIYRPIAAIGNSPLVEFTRTLPESWILVVVTFLVFLLGYVINVFSSFLLELTSFEIFEGTWIGVKLLKKGQERIFSNLQLWHTDEPNNSEKTDYLTSKNLTDLAYDFPRQKSELGFNRLGNILRAPASYVSVQYGASLSVIWPMLKLAMDQEETKSAIRKSLQSTLFFSNIIVLAAILILELLIVKQYYLSLPLSWAGIWLQIGLIVTGMIISYEASKSKARDWSTEMRIAFDLNLDETAKLFGLPESHVSHPTYKSMWEGLSKWLAYGGMDLSDRYQNVSVSDWHTVPVDTSKPTVSNAPSIVAEIFPRNVIKLQSKNIDAKFSRLYEEQVTYSLAISDSYPAKSNKWVPIDSTYLSVTDKFSPKLTRDSEVNVIRGGEFFNYSFKDGSPSYLIWESNNFATTNRTSRLLEYQVSFPLLNLRIVSNSRQIKLSGISGKQIGAEDSQKTVEVIASLEHTYSKNTKNVNITLESTLLSRGKFKNTPSREYRFIDISEKTVYGHANLTTSSNSKALTLQLSDISKNTLTDSQRKRLGNKSGQKVTTLQVPFTVIM